MTSGTMDKMKGRVKEAAGALTGSKKMKREGRVDQLAGKAKQAGQAVKEAGEKAIDKATDVAKGR